MDGPSSRLQDRGDQGQEGIPGEGSDPFLDRSVMLGGSPDDGFDLFGHAAKAFDEGNNGRFEVPGRRFDAVEHLERPKKKKEDPGDKDRTPSSTPGS